MRWQLPSKLVPQPIALLNKQRHCWVRGVRYGSQSGGQGRRRGCDSGSSHWRRMQQYKRAEALMALMPTMMAADEGRPAPATAPAV